LSDSDSEQDDRYEGMSGSREDENMRTQERERERERKRSRDKKARGRDTLPLSECKILLLSYIMNQRDKTSLTFSPTNSVIQDQAGV